MPHLVEIGWPIYMRPVADPPLEFPNRDQLMLRDNLTVVRVGAIYTVERDEGGGSRTVATSYAVPLPAPIKVNSRYGYRTDPVTGKKGALHAGIDFAARTGTPVFSCTRGTVYRVDQAGVGSGVNNGNCVIVNDGEGKLWYYMHLSRVLVRKGEAIRPGAQLGLSGATGKVSGPHLHVQIVDANGQKSYDPWPLLAGVIEAANRRAGAQV